MIKYLIKRWIGRSEKRRKIVALAAVIAVALFIIMCIIEPWTFVAILIVAAVICFVKIGCMLFEAIKDWLSD